MLLYLLIGLALLLVAFLIAAARQPDDLRVERRIIIAAPAAVAFAEINDPHNWPKISPYAKEDPAAKYTFAGPAAGVGSSVDWAGNVKVGTGRLTITDSRPPELVRCHFEFFKPMHCTNTTEFVLRPAGSGTEVTWAMSMKNNFFGKASGLFMNLEKMMGESFEAGLVNLKNRAEAAARQ
jgi:hypothetical protein